MKRLIWIALIVGSCFSLKAQSTWQRTYGDQTFNEGVGVMSLDSTSFIFLMNKASNDGNNEIWLLAADSLGEILWQRKVSGDTLQKATDFKRTIDGGYIIAGAIYADLQQSYDMLMIKTDSLGNRQWKKTFGGTEWDFAYALVQTPDSGFVLVGETYSYDAVEGDIYILKTNRLGNPLWTRIFGGDSLDFAADVCLTADSSLLIGANTRSYGLGDMDAWLIKMDNDGNDEWSAFYGDSLEDRLYSIEPTRDKGFVFVGSTRSFGADQREIWLMRFDSVAFPKWMMPVSWTIQPGDQYATNVSISDSGFFVISFAFHSDGMSGNDYGLNIMGDYWNFKAGTTYGGLENEVPTAAISVGNQGYLITGTTEGEGPSNTNMYVVKTDTMAFSSNFPVFTLDVTASQALMTDDAYLVYPNPSDGNLFVMPSVENSVHGPLNVILTDISGRIIFSSKYDKITAGEPLLIVIPDAQSGLYILQIVSDFGRDSYKVCIH